MKTWESLADCRANMHLIKLALSDYYNGRGGAVYGRAIRTASGIGSNRLT